MNYIVSDTDMTSVANAIRTKGNTQAPLEFPSGFVTAIGNIPTGGGSSVPQKDVNFFDYDGTVLHAYTAADFANLSAMPDNPTHDGLTAQGWNYTLAQAKAEVTAIGKCDIGQMYTTSDGKTRLYITISEDAPTYARTLYLQFGISDGSVTVDYGDGSATVTETSSSVSLSHDYTNTGDYVITLTVNSGSVQLNAKIFNDSSSNANLRTWLRRAEIGSGVTSIVNNAFTSCYGLQTITLPSDVTSIGSNAFSHCFGLQSITLPSDVTSIGISAFASCFGLQSIILPSGVTSISSSAFTSCNRLQSITLPSGLTSIGGSAFSSCYVLQSITLPSGLTSIGGSAFSSCNGLQSIILPSGVTSISSSAFSYCYGLQSITLPSGLTSIGDSAFSYCYGLQTITLPSGLTSIGSSVFSYCYALQTITLPSDVTSIGSNAFNSCTALRAIHFKPSTPPAVANSNAWSNLQTSCRIYVPTGKLSDYTSAQDYPDPNTYTYVEE